MTVPLFVVISNFTVCHSHCFDVIIHYFYTVCATLIMTVSPSFCHTHIFLHYCATFHYVCDITTYLCAKFLMCVPYYECHSHFTNCHSHYFFGTLMFYSTSVPPTIMTFPEFFLSVPSLKWLWPIFYVTLILRPFTVIFYYMNIPFLKQCVPIF
jgi:hypothetical protein